MLRSLCHRMCRKIDQTGDGISLYIFNPRHTDLAINRPVVVVAENDPAIRGLLPAINTDIGTAPADTHSRWPQILLCLLHQARHFESEMSPIGINQLGGFSRSRTRRRGLLTCAIDIGSVMSMTARQSNPISGNPRRSLDECAKLGDRFRLKLEKIQSDQYGLLPRAGNSHSCGI